MKCIRCLLVGFVVVLGVGLLVWLGMTPNTAISDVGPSASALRKGPALHIGLIPERDIFAQRRRYRALADFLSEQLDRPVELLSVNSYDKIILDFGEGKVDAAFLGSLVAVLTMDRMNARVLVKPEHPGQISTYRGLLFVPQDSPIQTIDDLAGKSVTMVRTTTGGNLFGIYEMMRRGLLNGSNPPKIVWVGTHDDAILEVINGRADAGAVKDLRLDEYQKAFPDAKFRRLAIGGSVPENGLVVRSDMPQELSDKLQDLLLKMDSTPRGQEALKEFGAVRFLPCRIEEYKEIYDIVDSVAVWAAFQIDGPPPRRPASLPRQ